MIDVLLPYEANELSRYDNFSAVLNKNIDQKNDLDASQNLFSLWGRHSQQQHSGSINVFSSQPTTPLFRSYDSPYLSAEYSIDDVSRYPLIDSYGSTTDPNNHNPHSFRYLIHAFSSEVGLSNLPPVTRFESSSARGNLGQQMKKYRDAKRASYYDPMKLGKRVTLSASLIDQDHRVTFGTAGYILETTNSNIIAAKPSSLFVNNWQRESALERAEEGRMSADNVLLQMQEADYSEILIGGERMQQGALRVVGVFYVSGQDGAYIHKDNAEHFVRLAQRYRLPVVPILNVDQE